MGKKNWALAFLTREKRLHFSSVMQCRDKNGLKIFKNNHSRGGKSLNFRVRGSPRGPGHTPAVMIRGCERDSWWWVQRTRKGILFYLFFIFIFLFVCLRDRCFALSPRLECNGTIIAHWSPKLLGSSKFFCFSLPNSWDHRCVSSQMANVLNCFVEMRYVVQAGRELVASSDAPTSVSQSAEITV